MAETLWKGKNVPIAIGGVTLIRAQEATFTESRDMSEIYQLGNQGAIGLDDNPSTITARLSWYPINVQPENAIIGVASSTAQVTLTDILNMAGVAVTGVTGSIGIAGARLTSLEYNVDVPNGRWTATATLSGTSRTTGTSVTPDTPTGYAAFKGKNAMMRFDAYSTETLLRIKRFTLRISGTEDRAYEFSTATPFDIEMLSPQVSGTVTWHANDSGDTPGPTNRRPEPAIGAGDNLEFQIGPGIWDGIGNIKYVLQNMVWESVEQAHRANQRAEHTINFRSEGEATDSGFTCEAIIA